MSLELSKTTTVVHIPHPQGLIAGRRKYDLLDRTELANPYSSLMSLQGTSLDQIWDSPYFGGFIVGAGT